MTYSGSKHILLPSWQQQQQQCDQRYAGKLLWKLVGDEGCVDLA